MATTYGSMKPDDSRLGFALDETFFQFTNKKLGYLLTMMTTFPFLARSLLNLVGTRAWGKLAGYICGGDPIREALTPGAPFVKCADPDCHIKIMRYTNRDRCRKHATAGCCSGGEDQYDAMLGASEFERLEDMPCEEGGMQPWPDGMTVGWLIGSEAMDWPEITLNTAREKGYLLQARVAPSWTSARQMLGYLTFIFLP